MEAQKAQRLNLGISIALSAGSLIAIEFMMWSVLAHRLHSDPLNAIGRVNDQGFYTAVMALLPVPLFLSWRQSNETEKRMKILGADASSRMKVKEEAFGNLCFTYIIILLCVNAMAGLLP